MGAPVVTAGPALAITFSFSNGTMTITGTSGNALEGRGCDDTLWGAAGPNTFDGGGGFDRCDDKASETAVSCEGNAPPLQD